MGLGSSFESSIGLATGVYWVSSYGPRVAKQLRGLSDRPADPAQERDARADLR